MTSTSEPDDGTTPSSDILLLFVVILSLLELLCTEPLFTGESPHSIPHRHLLSLLYLFKLILILNLFLFLLLLLFRKEVKTDDE